MRTLLFIVLLLTLQFTYAQKHKTDSLPDINTEELLKRIDSSSKATEELTKAFQKRRDSEEMAQFNEQNERNLEQFMVQQKARSASQSRSLIIRGSIFLLTIGLMIFGYVKKRRIKKMNEASNSVS